MRKLLILTIAMLCAALCACSSTEISPTIAGGNLSPIPQVQTAEIVIRSVLARVIPASVTRLRFTATDEAGNVVFGPELRDKAAVITLIVPITTRKLTIEYLEGDKVVGLFNQALDLTAGESFTINDPDFVDVNVVTLQSITVNPSDPSLAPGSLLSFTAIGNFSDATSNQLGAGVVWTSSAPAVATIDANGQATALADGTTTITATFQGVSGQTTLTVATPAVNPVATSLVITQQPVNSQATVPMGQVVVEVRDQNNALFTGASVPVTLAFGANPGGAVLGGTLTRDSVNGTVSFDDLTVSAAGTGYTLAASSPNLTGATSNAFDVRPAPGTATLFALPNAGSLPAGICAGPDGNLWFTEASAIAGRIGRITPAGVITEFNTGLSSPIQLLGICSSPADGSLYFTERNGPPSPPFLPAGSLGRVGVMTTAGVGNEFITLGAGSLPAGIALGSDGNIWWTLSSNQAPNDGSAIARNDAPPTATAFFSTGITAGPTLSDICAGPDGNMWFTENALAQVGRMDTSGVVINELPCGPFPTTIVSGPDGRLWLIRDDLAIGGVDAIEAMTTTGTVTTFLLPVDSNPQDICVGPDGNLWVTLTSFDGVSTTSGLARITTGGVMTTFQEPTMVNPVGICSGPDGNLWVTCAIGNAIARVVP
ncbi:hypothetical protein DYH09_28020 [bacterium CPR1]|nr:hypothetical protein [bacterium CPR1]